MVPPTPTIARRAARRSSVPRVLVAALACGAVLACGHRLRTAAADDSAAARPTGTSATGGFVLQEVSFGWDGIAKVGSWNPVSATVRSDAPLEVALVTTTADPEGCRADQPSLPVKVMPGEPLRLFGAYRPGRHDMPVRVRVESVQDGRVLAEREFVPSTEGPLRPSLPQSVRLVVTVGRPAGFPVTEPTELRELRGVATGTEQQSPQCVVAADALPRTTDMPAAWEAVDVIVLAGGVSTSESDAARLAEWVRGGGHLIVTVGRHAATLRSGPLAKWLPILPTNDDPTPVRELSGLEHFVAQSRRVEIVDPVPLARLAVPDGQVLLASPDGPLLARAPYGFGRVTVLAVDAQGPPLSNWEPLPEFWRRVIVGRRKVGTTARRADRGGLGHSGISDLASQVHAIQEQFDDLPRPSLWTVLGWTLAYLALIGPLDWFLVHRGLRRPQWTWATFPVFVVLASSAAVLTARTSNGNRDLVNSLEILDIDATDGLQRTRQWDTVFGVGNRRYAVDWTRTGDDGKSVPSAASESGSDAVAANSVAHGPTVSWSAVPENVFGGMYRAGGFELGRPGYRCGPLGTSIENLPLPVWSTRNLVADDLRRAAPVVESRLEVGPSGALAGSIVQRLGAPVEDWIIAFGTRVYVSPSIGREVRGIDDGTAGRDASRDALRSGVPQLLPAPNVLQRDLAGFLAGTVAVQRKRKENQYEPEVVYEQQPYDPLSRDPAYVLRMVTFHDVVEGRDYTGLSNDALRRWEMSHLLADGRAILFGRLNRPAGTLRLDGVPVEPARRDTFVRIVLPVRRTSTDSANAFGRAEPDEPE